MARDVKKIKEDLLSEFLKKEENFISTLSVDEFINLSTDKIIKSVKEHYEDWFAAKIFTSTSFINPLHTHIKYCYNSNSYSKLDWVLTKELNEKLICYIGSCLEIEEDQKKSQTKSPQSEESIYKEMEEISVSNFESLVMEAFSLLKNNKDIIGKLDSINSAFEADVMKLEDKYSIRLSDGRFYIASGDMMTIMRDPSDNPTWFIYFLKTHPLEKVPDLFPEMISKQTVDELQDYPLICHASLWKENGYVAIYLHTAWQHISATYKWKLDVPFEKAQVLFRVCNHPAKIFRTFGSYSNMAVNGEHLETPKINQMKW
jgi:hypothetical protein